MRPPARLLLEDGTVFCGCQVGGDQRGDGGRRSGVQHGDDWLPGDIDRSSCRQQIITLTCPHVGNVGTNGEDSESSN